MIQVAFPTLLKNQTQSIQLQELNQLIENSLTRNSEKAELVVTQNGNTIFHQRYGQTNVDNYQYPIEENTRVYATKLALMHLAENKQVDFNAPVNTYLPEYSGNGRDSVTIKQLLTNRSGYLPELLYYIAEDKLGNADLLAEKHFIADLIFNKIPINRELQAETINSEINYILLGFLIERVSGITLDDYLNINVYSPLNIQDIGFGNSVIQSDIDKPKTIYGVDGLLASAHSIAVMNQMFLNKGGYGFTEFFGPSILTSILQHAAPDAQGGGLQINSRFNKGDLFGFYASAEAYASFTDKNFVLIDPELDLSITFLTTSANYDLKNKYKDIINQIYKAVLD